jgi:hypothetical protein
MVTGPARARFLCLRLNWDNTALPVKLKRFRDVHIRPEAGYPFGRKGSQLAGAWRQLADAGTDGALILDGDVGVDMADVAAMNQAIASDPHRVWVAPARLWPTTSGQEDWVWAHRRGPFSQEICPDPEYFSFCFTYLPRALMAARGLDSWTFPHVDTRISEEAQRLRVPVSVVADCWPKHLHF